jgi:hypothetical protein
MKEGNKLKETIEDFIAKYEDSEGAVRIFCAESVDALCATAIIINSIGERKFSVRIGDNFGNKEIKQVASSKEKTFFFVGVGSDHVKTIKEVLPGKKSFFFSREEIYSPEGASVLNPFLDPRGELSLSGMSYIFSKGLKPEENKNSHLGLIGMVAEGIASNFFNQMIEDSVLNKTIGVEKGVNMPLAHSCSVYRAIANSLDPFIPGVSGSEKKSADFLEELKIKFDRKTRLIDLAEEDKKKLFQNILLRRLGSEEGNDILRDVYLVNLDGYNEELSDVNEVVRLIKSCIYLGNPSLGLSFCMNARRNSKRAETVLKQFRKYMGDALQWFADYRKTENAIVRNHYAIIDGKGSFEPQILFPFLEAVVESNVYGKGVLVCVKNYSAEGDIDFLFEEVGGSVTVESILDASSKFLIRESSKKGKKVLIKVVAEHESEFTNLLVSRLDSQELEEKVE